MPVKAGSNECYWFESGFTDEKLLQNLEQVGNFPFFV